MNAQLELEAQGLRILTACLLNGTAPYMVKDVKFWSNEPTDYREQWSHYRPDSACGGVILIEQFELETGKRLSHRTMLGTELHAYWNAAAVPNGRKVLAELCHRNQFSVMGVK